MANILEYLDWRGDLTLLERPFNEVDNLILAEICYLDFSGFVPAGFQTQQVTLLDAASAYFAAHPETNMGVLVPDQIPVLVEHAAKTARFSDVRLLGYVNRIDEETQTQFSALTMLLPDGSAYVAFRGTDDTIVGWKEDFNMAFTPEIPAQKYAAEYLRQVSGALPFRPLLVGGHSKGGNLAVYAAVFCGQDVQNRILAVYNNDGPGFYSSLLSLPEHKPVAGKITTLLPESSVVGMLLEHEEAYQVVRSTQVGLMQHDGFSWQVKGERFEHLTYMQNTKLHNGTKRKKRRHRFLFGVLLSALLITGALYGREYDISQLKNIEVMETLSSAVSQFGDRKLPVYSVQTTEKKIALSFDCAWGAEDFDSMMETLDKHNVKATFFMTGGFVSDNPECVKTLVEKGHELGNHSEHHYDMATITAGEMKTEIMDVHKKVKELTGKDMKVFRPPYGSYNNELIDTVYGCDYYPIQWDVDSLDWKNYGVQNIIDTVCNHKSLDCGSIILCHLGAKYTSQALDEMLTKLQDMGYEIVPVSKPTAT